MKLTTLQRKKFRVRNKLKKHSSVNRYRLTVSRSSKNIKKTKIEVSTIVAENLAKKAKELKINKIYFDRGVYKYHGRVKIFADTLRKNGMEF